ncbi:hypothetical protein [Roseovarius indicus]|uniref:hypothetical protein n=1 Tax=Roseovarius indicus TaxID=540747 RepID=UPI000A571CFF|nr:hypothetical protein [Roseovarius indicus]
MKNRICAIVLAAALAAIGHTAAADCNQRVGNCPDPKPQPQPTPDPVVAISLAPKVTWLDPGKLSDAPKRAGYGRLSFRLMNPKTDEPLDVDLTPDAREFADRSFLGWLGSFYNDTEQTYLLSIEVYEEADGENKLIHRRPVYAYSRRESFSSISDNQMIDFGGDIGFFYKNDEPRKVRLVLHSTKTTDFVTRNVERLFQVGNAGGEFNLAASGEKVSLGKLNSLVSSTGAGQLTSALELIDTLLAPFEQVQTIAASRTLKHLETGDTSRILADFYPQNARTAADREKHLRLEVSVDYTPSLLLTSSRPTWNDIRDSEIHVNGNIVQPLDNFVQTNDATKAAWADVGSDRHDTKRVCDSIADALNNRLVGADVMIAISAMLYAKQPDFSVDWNEDLCFGPDKVIFDEMDYAQYRFKPLELEVVTEPEKETAEEEDGILVEVSTDEEDMLVAEAETASEEDTAAEGTTANEEETVNEETIAVADDTPPDEKLRTATMTVLPAGLSGVLKIPDVRETVHDADSHYKAALNGVSDNGERRISLCDETGLFDTIPCNGGANATPYTVDALLHRLAKDVDLLEVNGVKVGLGCYTFLADEGADAAPNDLGSIAVIGNRTVEFLWQFKNRDGQPILDGLTISHPSAERSAIYEANRGGGCGATAVQNRIWAFNGETEGA